MLKNKVYVIGVSPKGDSSLSLETHRLTMRAEIVLGGTRLLKMFPSLSGKKIAIKNNLAEVIAVIKANLGHKRIAVLASGDPGFYGIGSYLIKELGKNAVEILPNVSAMQLAFARVGESWEDAVLTSVHGRLVKQLVEIVRDNNKIGIFTDDENNPARIADVLRESGIENCKVYVCEELGTPNEHITETKLYSLKVKDFSPLNVMILVREQKEHTNHQLLGIPEASFHRSRKGLITKLEVRAISLAKMALNESSIVWDIGAGSGSVSIEASFIASKGRVFAIEKSDDAIAIIRRNIKKFHVNNVEVVHAFAPEGLNDLPAPTSVFIGGSNGRLEEILTFVSSRLKTGGHIVINLVSLENLNSAVHYLREKGFKPEVTLVSVARSKDVMELTRLEALNPIFIVAATRERNGKR